jgi:hypothetical protein
VLLERSVVNRGHGSLSRRVTDTNVTSSAREPTTVGRDDRFQVRHWVIAPGGDSTGGMIAPGDDRAC